MALTPKQKLTARISVWRTEVTSINQRLRGTTTTAAEALRLGARRTELGQMIREAEQQLADIEAARRG